MVRQVARPVDAALECGSGTGKDRAVISVSAVEMTHD
jgi:hypothetical protein